MRSPIRQVRPGTGRTRRVRTAVCAAAVLALLAACNDEPSGLDAEVDGPPIVVTAAEPRESGQGETMKVRITGSGFRQGDEAVWERDGSSDDRIVVEKTEFVSPTQLVATISIQADAPAASYDIAVSRPRKKGIGTEAFYVLHGLGSEFQARFSFTYDGYRSGSFNVNDTFVLDPATMDPGSWGLTHFTYEYNEQFLGAHYLRDDGLVDMMWCWVPGGRVTAPGTREFECWFTPQYNFATGEYADPEDYTSFIGGDRPGDGTGRITFTSVTPERLAGTFSITMHVVDWPDWLGSPTITIQDGEFDLPVVSSYYDRGEESTGGGGGDQAVSFGIWSDINDHGVVVGQFGRKGLRWTVGSDGSVMGPEDLGLPAGMSNVMPTAINNHGVIVGNTAPGNLYRHGFIHDGQMRLLRPLAGAARMRVWGINDQGMVVGDADMIEDRYIGDLRAVVWLDPLDWNQQPIELPQLGAGGPAMAGFINNEGVIAGWSGMGGLRWQLNPDGTVTGPELIGLAYVNGMNDAPDFAGRYFGESVLLRGDRRIPLEPLPGHSGSGTRAVSTPPAGQPVTVTGSSRPATGPSLPVVWSIRSDGSVTGPVSIGVRPGSDTGVPWAINTWGWIVGYSSNVADHSAYLNMVGTVWIPRARGYEIITLAGLPQSESLRRAVKAPDLVGTIPQRCRARPGRPDRCR